MQFSLFVFKAYTLCIKYNKYLQYLSKEYILKFKHNKFKTNDSCIASLQFLQIKMY